MASSLLLNIPKISKCHFTTCNVNKPAISHSRSLQLASARHAQIFGDKISYKCSSSVSNAKQKRRFFSVAEVSKGDIPPAFTLKDQDEKAASLLDFKGKPVVLYFYPADESPGCTKEACAFRDSYEKFKTAGAEVIGVSADSPQSHKAFGKKYKLPFSLLSDEGNKVRKEWGIPGDIFGTIPGRQTYVIDKNGVVQLVYNNQLEPEKHIEETLGLLQGL